MNHHVTRACWAFAGSVVILTALAAFAPLSAQQAAPAAGSGSADKPFAEHHLALQLSDDDAKKQGLVISVANNLLKFYGPDKIAIEVVAFGPGIMNTVETIERDTGHHVPLNPKAKQVEAGVAQILALTEKGYTLVRP
jgi:uncharacterized protein